MIFENYNLFIPFFRFRNLEAEEAFNIACCDEIVQNSILAKDFKHDFSKICDLEAQIDFTFHDDSKVVMTKEDKKLLREEKKEAKRLKQLKREERKAKYEADIKAKMDKQKNNENV